jgi:spore coat polysaccharide biosynthesis protein SpsF
MGKANKPHVVAILQARMGATRLPGKPLLSVLGKPLLGYQLERLHRAATLDKIVVATTTAPDDHKIADLCHLENVLVYKGSEEDVLQRYYEAAKLHGADIVVRVTGDCPLIDPAVVDRAVTFFLTHMPKYDYVANSPKRTYPRGLDVEVFSFRALERAQAEASKPMEREHVTPYFYLHPELFTLGCIEREPDLSHHRWTVDTAEDFALIERLITALYPDNPDFTTEDILAVLKEHPDWSEINAHIQQKQLGA